ncbi:MAG: HAMP domain-containing sensor histidine kinase [Anaerovoracaceae bacterium]|nr:HAMP domain-containing sensor histidine kinase [Anaerovoracaceae bacterium]
MDTKLKNTDRTAVLRTVYGLGWLVTALSGAACAILSSMAACLASMTDLKSYIQAGGDKQWAEGNPWFVDIPDMDAFSDVLANLITWAAVCGVILAASVVVLCVLTGRMGRNEDGSIHLNWFDRIWSEIHMGGVCGFATAAVALCMPIMRIYALTSWTDVFVPSITVDHWFGPSNSFIVKLCIAGIMASVMLTVLCLVSLVKKLKARQFWEKSLLGGLFLFIYRGLKKSFKESDSTLIKTVCVLILGALLSATWFGLPVVVVLILIFVPRIVKKFTDIKTGVARVKGGDLAYKIPVEDDAQGVRGELDRLAADINDISEAAGLAVENELKNQRMKTELISNVSHDLKTPLTSMVSYVDLLKTEGLDSPNAPSYLEIIDEKTQRLRVLTEDLFEAAKASSGAIPVNMESIDLAALVSQSLGEMGEKLSAKGLDVIVKNEIEDSSAHGVGVMADGQLLWRVIENLLSNVSKYALEGSRVYVNISSPEDSKVLLEIKNISASELNISAEELMERFTRGDESRNTEGSGLGLAIAKDLTRLMKGQFKLTVDGDLFKAGVLLERA